MKRYNFIVGITSILLIQSGLISQTVLDPDAELEVIATGLIQPEGPVWKEGLGLLFSDIQGNKIYKWTADSGKQVFLYPSDSTNGLTYDLQGRLVAGQMGKRRIVRFEDDGMQISLADRYDGKRFNSPNDLVVKSDGSIFFTDPDFNIPGGSQNKELDFNGIYRISPTGNLQLLTTLTLPNGICFSPDESKLYVNDSQAHKIYVWDVVDDSLLTNKQLFYTIPVVFGYADGMKIDGDGNIYCTCSSAVWVVTPAGVLLGKIDLPSGVSASNCAWGGSDNKTLFITAGTSIYKIRPFVSSIEKHTPGSPEGFMLFPNYPNPFNPSTRIAYSIPARTKVMIKVYNIAGKEVAMIENGERNAGTHAVSFNAKQLASGIYLYQLTAGDLSATERFVLMK